MEEIEYYKLSKENDLPLRCPIINYCSRRALTVYLFSEYSKFEPSLNVIQALNRAGEIPNDFEDNSIMVQGVAPSIIRGSDHYYFSDVCPEVNLFDSFNSLIFGKACTKGQYDRDFKGEKKRVIKSQHFSECPEFNKYMFDNDRIKKSKVKTNRRKAIPHKLKALLQKEIKSKCPFCENDDVDHFQIHHIDEISNNNTFENLLMLCPNCHSKITKGDISKNEVINRKIELKN